jgi:hypothetical protein
MPSVGHPVAYTPIPSHNTGDGAHPALVSKVHPDGTVNLMVFVHNRAEPAHFENVPRGTGPHTWDLPDLTVPAATAANAAASTAAAAATQAAKAATAAATAAAQAAAAATPAS